MKAKFWSVATICLVGYHSLVQGCVWDSKTLSQEKREHPTLAKAILHPEIEKPDVSSLTRDIQNLKSNPKTNDPAWWNELAGAYLRLGQSADAIKLLEPVTNQFSNDYGIHANLGTAYHLAGRYVDAEREIRRDLEINPGAHFGLEKYHLALLQYLMRDETYKMRHFYVDEFSYSVGGGGKGGSIYGHLTPELRTKASEALTTNQRTDLETELAKAKSRPETDDDYYNYDHLFEELAQFDSPPPYVFKWDLAADTNLERGVIYMATLNPKEPACMAILGVVAQTHRDLNLAKIAYQKAIDLGSPQARSLKGRIDLLNKFHAPFLGIPYPGIYWVGSGLLIIAYYIYSKWRDARRRARPQ